MTRSVSLTNPRDGRSRAVSDGRSWRRMGMYRLKDSKERTGGEWDDRGLALLFIAHMIRLRPLQEQCHVWRVCDDECYVPAERLPLGTSTDLKKQTPSSATRSCCCHSLKRVLQRSINGSNGRVLGRIYYCYNALRQDMRINKRP